MWYKNNKICILFGIFTLYGCGFSTGGQSLDDLSTTSLTMQYYQTPKGNMNLYVDRNTSFNNASYTKLVLSFKTPLQEDLPGDASRLPDFTYALALSVTSAPALTQNNPASKTPNSPNTTPKPDNTTEDPLKDSSSKATEKPIHYLLTFGDVSRAEKFLYPQEKDAPHRLAITNLHYQQGGFFIPRLVSQRIKDRSFSPPHNFFYTFQNAFGGCALFCEGATAILPNKSRLNPDEVSYSLIIWLFDKASPPPLNPDLGDKQLTFTLGYINKQGIFVPFGSGDYPPLMAPLNLSETRSDYKKRIYKEKHAYMDNSTTTGERPLDDFFQSITGRLTDNNGTS